MSAEDLELLRQQEEALRQQMEAIASKRRQLEEEARKAAEAERRRQELEKPVVVTVMGRQSGGAMVALAGDYREDVVAEYRLTKDRAYQGTTGRNLVPVREWAGLEVRLLALPNLTIDYRPGVKEDLEWYLTAPVWEVRLHPNGREFLCIPGPGARTWALQAIPGSAIDHEANKSTPVYNIPTSEGWRLWQALEKVDGVIFDDAARERLFEQITRRARLDTIAKKLDSDIVIPFPAGCVPRPFQRVGIEFIEEAGGRCLLGDEMGLGKTWQALGYAERQRQKNARFQTIIICPATLKPNWVREVKKLTGKEPVICSGGSPDFFTIQAIVMKRAPYVIINYDLMGIEKAGEDEDETFNPWVSIINSSDPDLVICDEAHFIKNPDAKRTKGTMKIAVSKHFLPMSGTPIMNRPGELWPVLRMLDPVNFKSRDTFLTTYTYDGKQVRNVDELHEMLKPMYLRRTKKEVLKDLPPINRVYQFHELSTEAQKSYDLVMSGIYEELKAFDPRGEGGHQKEVMNILARIMRLKQVCAADKVERVAELATDISDSHSNGRPGKVLIFSQFKGTAYEISRRLGQDALSFVTRITTAKGMEFETVDIDERDRLVQEFRQNDDIRYLVVTEKSAKEGHNIEFAEAVIFNDLFWTPAAHEQGEGRIYGRLSGEMRSVDAHYIISEKTIEEWIMDLLAAKLSIINEVVEGVETSRKDVSVAMELIARLKSEMWRKS